MTRKLIHKRGGFTLVELVVIMVLIGILAAVVMPRFFDSGGFRARGYFDELISATRYAQKLAVASGCEARITITAGGFTLEQPATAAECGSPGIWQEVSVFGSEPPYTAPSGVSADPATFTFSASGRENAGTVQEVSVGTFTMRVHGATGYVERL